MLFTSNSHTNPLEQAETNQIFCIFLNLVAVVVQAFLEGRTELFFQPREGVFNKEMQQCSSIKLKKTFDFQSFYNNWKMIPRPQK